MNYIIFDLEFNQDYKSVEETKNILIPKCPFEIIQIGAIKLNENLKKISIIDKLIKPEIYTNIHPFVNEMTGITMDLLNTAEPFIKMYKEFIEFVKTDRCVLCVWGMTDIKELFRNIAYYSLDISMVPKECIDIQLYASKYFNCPKGTNIGLSNAVELLNIPVKSQFHNAFNDACYTFEVFKRIYNENIKPSIYNPNKQMRFSRPNNEKKKLDAYSLIKQFEKMFNRELTTEEKSMIKLAYMMGKTNQFQIKTSNGQNNYRPKS